MFGTQFLNECPQELWGSLDATAIAEDMGAVVVKLNGPRHWRVFVRCTSVSIPSRRLRWAAGQSIRRSGVPSRLPIGSDAGRGLISKP